MARASPRSSDSPELADDPRFATLAARKRNEDELEALVDRVDARRAPPEAAAAALQAAGIPAFVVGDATATSPRTRTSRARGFFVDARRTPRSARELHLGRPVAHVGQRLPRAPRRARASAQHTDDVLRDVCGYGAEDIARLRAAGVLT